MKKPILLALIVGIALSSITLWLLQSPLKYVLCLLEIILILVIYNSLSEDFWEIRFETGEKLWKIIDRILLVMALTLFFSAILGSGSMLNLIFGTIVSFFLPGYVLLRLLRFHSLNSWIEWVVLAFVLSIVMTSLVSTLALPFASYRAIITSAIYVALSFLPMLKYSTTKLKQKLPDQGNNQVKKYDLVGSLLLIWVSLFFIIAISSLYPQMAYRPGQDMVDHLSLSKLLLIAPEAYESPYPWFHLTWATVYELSNPSMEMFQTCLAFLSLISIFSFYIMANAYSGDINKYVPKLATIFFSVFSGFGWLYLAKEKIFLSDSVDPLHIHRMMNDVSYLDTSKGEGVWIWLWFRPITLGVIGLFVLFYLLRRQDLERKSFFVLSYFTVLSLSFTHLPEIIFYSTVLFSFSIPPFSKFARVLRLKHALLAVLLALVSVHGFLFVYDLIGITVSISVFYVMLIPLVLLTLVIIRVKEHIPNLISNFPKAREALQKLMLVFSVLWLAMLLYWFVNPDCFHTSMVSSIHAVPWILYPVLLGICGILTFPAVSHIVRRYGNHPVLIFALMFFFGIVFGRLLTYVNVNWFYTGYWERRIIPLTLSSSAVLSSVLVWHFIKQLKRRHIAYPLLLSMLVVSGLASTGLIIEHKYLTTPVIALTTDEQNLIGALEEIDPNTHILYFSERSGLLTRYVPFAWRIENFRNHIWPATSPELVLDALFSTGHPAAIFLTEADYHQLSPAMYTKSYVLTHLTEYLPSLHQDSNSSIYAMDAVAPPSEQSDIVYVYPQNNLAYFVSPGYDVLSASKYNYTTSYISDLQTLSKAETVIVPSEKLAVEILRLKDAFTLKFDQLIILNLDGYYGELAALTETDYMTTSISVLLEDFAEACLIDPISQKALAGDFCTGVIPFAIEANTTDNSLVLVDDEAACSYVANAFGNGDISAPILDDDSEIKISGTDSLRITVGSGTYRQWAIEYEFENTTNVEDYDCLSFYWYGKANEARYAVTVNTNVHDRFFWYEFVDDWEGWKKVILPIHIDDGKHASYGISFTKTTQNQANWREVSSITFKLSAKNPSLGGTFHVDCLRFERAPVVGIEVAINSPLKALRLMSLTTTNRVPITKIQSNETLLINEYYLFNGSPVSKLIGKNVGEISLRKCNSNYSEVFLRIKMPIPPDDSMTVQAQFALEPLFQRIEVSTIEFGYDTIELPEDVHVIPLRSNAHESAIYGDTQTFLAAEYQRDGIHLNYVNFYPIIEAINNGSNTLYMSLGNITRRILGDLSSYTFQNKRIDLRGTAAFEKTILTGNITMSFDSVIFKMDGTKNLKIKSDEKSVDLTRNVAEFCPMGTEKAIFNSDYIEIVPGGSFYINARLKNSELTISGNPAKLAMLDEEGTAHSISGKKITLAADVFDVSLRKPQITIDGKGRFTSLYIYTSHSDLFKRQKIIGADCEIEGRFSFEGTYGDIYTITENFDYVGDVRLLEPLYTFDDISSLLGSTPYILVVALLFIVVAIIRARRGGLRIRLKIRLS